MGSALADEKVHAAVLECLCKLMLNQFPCNKSGSKEDSFGEEIIRCISSSMKSPFVDKSNFAAVVEVLLKWLGDQYPTEANPAEKGSLRYRVIMLITKLMDSSLAPNIKLPGIEEFPMDFKTPPKTMSTSRSFTAERSGNEFYGTGFYLQAGTSLECHVKSMSGGFLISKIHDCEAFDAPFGQ